MKKVFFCAVALALMSTSAAFAQTAAERAGELKAWREQCSDPDSDLRMAYVEAALETNDTAVTRICIRQSLESDNTDIRNLGLRAALADVEQLAFTVEPPELLLTSLEEAKDNEDRLEDIYDWYISRDWRSLKNGLVFAVQKPDFVAGTATWLPLVNQTKFNERHTGKLTVLGDAATWVGSAALSTSECSLSVKLVAGPALEGEWLCARGEPFKVRAELL